MDVHVLELFNALGAVGGKKDIDRGLEYAGRQPLLALRLWLVELGVRDVGIGHVANGFDFSLLRTS